MKKIIASMILIAILMPIVLAQDWAFVDYFYYGSNFRWLRADDRNLILYVADCDIPTIDYFNKTEPFDQFNYSSPQYLNWAGICNQVWPSPYEDYIYGVYSIGTPKSFINQYSVFDGSFIANSTPRCYRDFAFANNKIYGLYYSSNASGYCVNFTDLHYFDELDLDMNLIRRNSVPISRARVIEVDQTYVYVLTYVSSAPLGNVTAFHQSTFTHAWNVSNVPIFVSVDYIKSDENYIYGNNYSHIVKISKVDGSYVISPESMHPPYEDDIFHIWVDQKRVYASRQGVTSDDCRVYMSHNATVWNKETLEREVLLNGTVISGDERITVYDKPVCDSYTEAFSCGDVGLRFDSVAAFFASIPEFLFSMITCVAPAFIVIFATGIAGVLLLIFKVLREKSR